MHSNMELPSPCKSPSPGANVNTTIQLQKAKPPSQPYPLKIGNLNPRIFQVSIIGIPSTSPEIQQAVIIIQEIIRDPELAHLPEIQQVVIIIQEIIRESTSNEPTEICKNATIGNPENRKTSDPILQGEKPYAFDFLQDTVSKRDTNMARSLLSQGINRLSENTNSNDDAMLALLPNVIKNDDADMLNLFLDTSDKKYKLFQSALTEAIRHDKIQIADLLLNKFIDHANRQDPKDENTKEIISQILSNSCKETDAIMTLLTSEDKQIYDFVLLLAIKNNKLNLVNSLLINGVSENFYTGTGLKFLHKFALSQNTSEKMLNRLN